MKLINLIKSPNPEKKFRAVFEDEKTGRKRKTDFGAKGMDDYTITKDKEQRERYRERHKKDLKTGDPTRAGYLSYDILWGPSTSVERNLALYKSKYSL
jgi:hypothetical protein